MRSPVPKHLSNDLQTCTARNVISAASTGKIGTQGLHQDTLAAPSTWTCSDYMDVSENGGTPKASILIGFSIINHPFWGTSIFGNIHMVGISNKNINLLQICSSPFWAIGFRSASFVTLFDMCIHIYTYRSRCICLLRSVAAPTKIPWKCAGPAGQERLVKHRQRINKVCNQSTQTMVLSLEVNDNTVSLWMFCGYYPFILKPIFAIENRNTPTELNRWKVDLFPDTSLLYQHTTEAVVHKHRFCI